VLPSQAIESESCNKPNFELTDATKRGTKTRKPQEAASPSPIRMPRIESISRRLLGGDACGFWGGIVREFAGGLGGGLSFSPALAVSLVRACALRAVAEQP
jgi:hypothetical protein